MILLLNLVLIACDPSQAYPPILNKPIKGDKISGGKQEKEIDSMLPHWKRCKEIQETPQVSLQESK